VPGVEEPVGCGQGEKPDADAERDVRDNELVAECVTRRLITRGSAGAAELIGLRIRVQANVERAAEREQAGAAEHDGENRETAGLGLGLLGSRRARDERGADGAVLLSLASDETHLGDAATGALEANDVSAGIERDGMTVERGRDRLAVEENARIGDVAAVGTSREHDGGDRTVEIDERLRAVLANELGAGGDGASEVARARVAELACRLQRLSAIELGDALGLGGSGSGGRGVRRRRRGRRSGCRRRSGGLLRAGRGRHEERRSDEPGGGGAGDQRHSTL